MAKLTDKSPFPFGKYKGLALVNVKDEYLLWLTEQSWIKDWKELNEYLQENLEAIKKNVAISKNNRPI